MSKISVLGIDLAKNVFQLHGIDEKGKTVLQKRLSRTKLVGFICNLPPCLIEMEACGEAHYFLGLFFFPIFRAKALGSQCLSWEQKVNEKPPITCLLRKFSIIDPIKTGFFLKILIF